MGSVKFNRLCIALAPAPFASYFQQATVMTQHACRRLLLLIDQSSFSFRFSKQSFCSLAWSEKVIWVSRGEHQSSIRKHGLIRFLDFSKEHQSPCDPSMSAQKCYRDDKTCLQLSSAADRSTELCLLNKLRPSNQQVDPSADQHGLKRFSEFQVGEHQNKAQIKISLNVTTK